MALVDQKSASITQRTVKLVYVTKFTHSHVDTIAGIYWYRLTLLTFNLPSKFHFTKMYHNVFAVSFPVVIISSDYNCALLCTIGESCIVHIRSRRKESSRSLSHLLMSFLFSEGKQFCQRFSCRIVLPIKFAYPSTPFLISQGSGKGVKFGLSFREHSHLSP